MFAQFLTAFADNAILFTAITMVMQATDTPAWYIPALQGSFLVAFVLCAPWVGSYADRRPKAHVLTIGNIVKGVGAGMMLLHVEPLLSYAVVGLGAAIYGPAKYGILPESANNNWSRQTGGSKAPRYLRSSRARWPVRCYRKAR